METIVVEINNEVEISPDHPFRTSEGWKPAAKVEIGDRILTKEGWIKVVSINRYRDTRDYYDFQIDKDHNFYLNNYLITSPRAMLHSGSVKAMDNSQSVDPENFEGMMFGVHEEKGNTDSDLVKLRDSKEKRGRSYMEVSPAEKYVIQGYKSDKEYFDYIGLIIDSEKLTYSDERIVIEDEEQIVVGIDTRGAEEVIFVTDGWFDPTFREN